MVILHITNCLRGGGIQNFLLSLLPEQVSIGHRVLLIVIEKYDYDYCFHLEKLLRDNGVIVIRLNKIRSNKVSFFKSLIRCCRIVNEIKPNIVNTHGEMSHVYGSICTLGRNIKQIITIHNAPEVWPISARILCKNKPLVFCSEAAYRLRKQVGQNMITINNGVSEKIVRTCKRVDIREELNLKKTDKIIILVGSMRPQKNYLFLKELVDQMKDLSIHFCICGGSYGEGYVEAKEFSSYNNIHCLGLRSDVSAIENGADLFLSCAKFEGLPIAVLEAYFNGIPCVLSPIVQHENISNVYNVYIPKDFKAKSFIDCIYIALSNTESHEAILNKRKSQIEQYSIKNTAIKYIEFYNKILNG
ncbi:MAG TPA: glycosyltransferase family 4 protein [Megamonas hypermegale]|nr:glycosyltransferase family 4 protein [Megamonas hypermegale]